jgi:hypothetical protein
MATQYEYELEGEMTPLHEWEMEADPFFGKIGKALGGLAKRALPALKKLAPLAARTVFGAIPGVGAVAGPLAGKLASALTREQQEQLEAVLQEAATAQLEASQYEFGQHEFEGEGEFENLRPEWEALPSQYASPEYEGAQPEFEGEQLEFEGISPEFEGTHHEFEAMNAHASYEAHPEYEAGLPHSEATHQEAQLMEQIAHEASVVATEAEAEALVGSLVPLAVRSARTGAPVFRAAAPALARASGRLAGALRGSPATRPLVRALPTILRRTRSTLMRRAAQGAPITPRVAVRAMADQTYRVIGNPTICIRIIMRTRRRGGHTCARCGGR